MKYKLTNDDYKKINKIIDINYNIISLYKDLICLDSNDNYDSVEYNNLYNKLREYIYKEDNLYKELYDKTYIAYAMCEYMSSNFKFTADKDYTDSELIFLRIFKNLCDCFLLTEEYIDDNLDMFFTRAGMQCDLGDLILNDKMTLMLYLNYFKEDLNNGYINFIEEYINEFNGNYNVCCALVNEKYYKLMLNKGLEKRFLKNKIRNNNIDISSNFIYDLDICNESVCRSLTYIYNNYNVLDGISNILAIDDLDYEDNSNTIVAIKYQAIIRTCLLFMDDDTIMDVNDSFHEHIDNNKDKNVNNTISQRIILDCFKKVKKDKLKKRVISFHYNK